MQSLSMPTPTTSVRETCTVVNFRLPRAIWTLGLVSLLMDVSSELIHSLLPVFLFTTLGASAFVIGLIDGVAEATALIVKVFSGALSDYWGRRKPLAALGYGLGAISKPLFALATSAGTILAARLIDRVGKGIRGAPRDALVADIAPEGLRGAAFGLRQSLDTVGAFLGPLLAMTLMLLWANDFRAVFWVAVIPGFLAVALLFFGVKEPAQAQGARPLNPIRRANLRRLPRAYWWVVTMGAVFTLARFSEAFLVLRAQQGGLPLALAPMVLITMNMAYALSAYPFGKLSDRMSHTKLLAFGLVVLLGADLALSYGNQRMCVGIGVTLWGIHMGMTQGLMATMVADAAPKDLRGTAYGFFNLLSGVAMLVASALAGLLWDRFGAAKTFLAGAVFTAVALGMLLVGGLHDRVPRPPDVPA
jgi:MFS family permease